MVDINGTLLIQIVNFLIFVAILGHFCYKPVIKVLDERKQHIKNDLDSAANNRADAEKLKESYEADTKGAKEASAGIIREARQKADQEASVILSQARKEADKIRTDTEERLKQEREKTMRGLQKDVADLAVEAAEQILSGGSRQREDEAFYDMFLRNAGEQKNAVQRGENA